MTVLRKLMLKAEPVFFSALKPMLQSSKARVQRSLLIQKYAKGQGAEIGAFTQPCMVPNGSRTLYIDRVPASHWKTDPRFAKEKVVEVDIVDDGVELSTVAADHLDYLIAAHVLEHADNPIRALQNWLRVVKPGGHLIVIVPDMRHMWDHNREVTPLDHFFRDYEEGPTTSAADHYREIARRSMGWTDEEKIEEYVAINEPAVHFHTWTFESFLEFLVAVNKYLEHPYEVVEAQLNIGEAVAVLKVL